MSKKLTTAMKIAKCADKLFDSLVEEKLLDKDNEIVANIKAAKNSFMKTADVFYAEEMKEKKEKKEKKAKKKAAKRAKTTPSLAVLPTTQQ